MLSEPLDLPVDQPWEAAYTVPSASLEADLTETIDRIYHSEVAAAQQRLPELGEYEVKWRIDQARHQRQAHLYHLSGWYQQRCREEAFRCLGENESREQEL